eukprot:1263658-Heterocapsa_arctica.AAC.1
MSAGIPIPKHNAKSGCASLRPLRPFDPFGRRREEALLVTRAAQWHLRKARVGFVTSYWDVTNAFGSTTHDALNSTVDQLSMGHDAHFVKS